MPPNEEDFSDFAPIDSFSLAGNSEKYEYADFLLAHGLDISIAAEKLSQGALSCHASTDEANYAAGLRRIRFLISRGAIVAGSTALVSAVRARNMEVATCLIDGGADVNGVLDPPQYPALLIAVDMGHQGMVQLLLDRGADVKLFCKETNAVPQASAQKNRGIVKLVQKHQLKSLRKVSKESLEDR